MFKGALWKETLWYNAMRAACAGLVWGILMQFMSPPGGTVNPVVAVFMWPIMLVVIGLPVYFVMAGILENVIGVLAVIPLAFAALFFVTAGDPIVWLINRFAPQAVPMDRPPFLSFKLLYLIHPPDAARVFVGVEVTE